jgi:hypothetical protein
MKHYDDNGLLHNENGPAYVVKNHKEWWFHGKRHREDGPAVIRNNGNLEWWYIHDKLHRLDGPAILSCGYGYWFINGNDVTKKINKWAKERDIDLNNLSDLEKSVIALEWGNYKAA